MSIGLYLVSNHYFNEQRNPPSVYSLKELAELGYTSDFLKEHFKNWFFEIDTIDPNEKVFYLEREQPFSFELLRDTGPQTIANYTQKKHYYEIIINQPREFYADFIAYLTNYDCSYELWKIGEGKFDPDSLQVVDTWEVSEKWLAKIIGEETYLYPKMGSIW